MADAVPVWMITGCSSGFGQELAKLVIGRGWRVAVTALDSKRISSLAEGAEDRVILLDLDVTKPDQINSAVAATKAHFGRIDVLVNNAGFGYLTSIEEGEDAQVRALFDANVFGLFAVTRATLPVMRSQRSGHVINVSSGLGMTSTPLFGYYSATKHAVEGFSKALTQEVAPFGVKVTCIEPGPFRTAFFTDRSVHAKTPTIDDYVETLGARLEAMGDPSRLPGDPVRACEAMIAITQEPDPPHHLVLGKIGFDDVTAQLRRQIQEIESRRETSLAADFPDA